MKRNFYVLAMFLAVLAALEIGSLKLEKRAAEAAGVEAPMFEVDPMWPKPLPNHWLLGMTIGLLQDSLSGPTVPLGLYGIAKTIIGYLASSIGGRLDTEHPIARFALTMVFFCVHQAVILVTRRILLAQPDTLFTLHLAIGAGVNAIVGVFLFMALDKLRKN